MDAAILSSLGLISDVISDHVTRMSAPDWSSAAQPGKISLLSSPFLSGSSVYTALLHSSFTSNHVSDR